MTRRVSHLLGLMGLALTAGLDDLAPAPRRTRPEEDATGPTILPDLDEEGTLFASAPAARFVNRPSGGDGYSFIAPFHSTLDRPLSRASLPPARPADPDKKRQRKAERKARRANRGRR